MRSRALKFPLYHDSNEYGHEFDNVPKELCEDDIFDDNGDIPSGDCALIPIDKDLWNGKYEIVNVDIINTLEETQDLDSEEKEEWLKELSDRNNYIYWNSQDRLIQQVVVNARIKCYNTNIDIFVDDQNDNVLHYMLDTDFQDPNFFEDKSDVAEWLQETLPDFVLNADNFNEIKEDIIINLNRYTNN